MRAILMGICTALLTLTFSPSTQANAHSIQKHETNDLESFLSQCFPNNKRDEILIHDLKGGLSSTDLYKVEVDGKKYVLRVHRSVALNNQDRVELFAFNEAAKKGISPQILWVSSNKQAILMECIDEKTLTVEQAKLPENIVKMAHAFQKIHQISGDVEGESLLSKAHRCYPIVFNKEWAPQQEVTAALELIKKYTQELLAYPYSKVCVHGDLNPRNIFLTSSRILFIDWAETTLEDPFYDLSYFALKLDYSLSEERLLIEHYLQRLPTSEEFKRYQIHKKIHQAFWSLTNLYLADVELKKYPEDTLSTIGQIKSWSYYQKAFADNSEELSAQYFYDLSRLNYRKAILD